MVTPSTEEEVEEEVEVEEEKNGFRKDKWIDQMEDWEEDSPMAMEYKCNKCQQEELNLIHKRKIGLFQPM